MTEHRTAPKRYRVIGLPAPSEAEVSRARAALKLWAANRCAAVRDLFAGTPETGTVIQTCERDHHMDVHAHRMTNPDGSVTTWRS
ncbi:MAG TPA: hypothetical protein VF885_16915 [Arthrobacter sp.]